MPTRRDFITAIAVLRMASPVMFSVGCAWAQPLGPEAQITHATRKQVYDLTLADLNAIPVWEFAPAEEDVPGRDEATVRAYFVTPPIDTGHGGVVVRATFTLADGTNMRGYLSPQPTSLRKPDKMRTSWTQESEYPQRPLASFAT